MTMRMRAAVLGPWLVFFAGCPQDTTLPDPVNIPVTVDKESVVADGTTSVLVTVSHTSDVKITASRGKFKDQKGNSVNVTGGSGTVELVTCDSRAVVGCAGNIRINVTSVDGLAAGSVRVEFSPLENCGNGVDDNGDDVVDCADPSCVDYTCSLPPGSVGEGACQANGTCLCKGNGGTGEPNEASCSDGKDNDCDGLVDCADANCENKTCILLSGGQGICLASECGCPGTTEEEPEACSDKMDNDCDGRVDCADPGCQAKLGEPGVLCDEFGRTCSRGLPDGGGSCSVCPGGEDLSGEVTCSDQKDNDCDGLSDCEDSHCVGLACGENGRACNGTNQRCECTGNGGPVETIERTCGDGADNDCDGKADCEDEDCKPAGSIAGKACAPFGYFCTADGKCGCSGNGGKPEDDETTCSDGADNDCDGIKDCEETVCQPLGNGIGQICDTKGHLATGIGELTCSSTILDGGSTCNVCTVPGGTAETAEGVSTTSGGVPSCGDGLDNDCDGPMDCGDTNCTGMPCDNTGKRCNNRGQCTCAPTLGTDGGVLPELSCTDGVDNDCDGLVDCADTTCDNRACILANGAPGRCKAGACGCPGIAEDTDVTCSDGIDDDCDGLIDCADPDCQASLAAAGKGCDSNGKQCGKPDSNGRATCSVCSRSAPLPDGGVRPEAFCLDGQDNDCDGQVDCADSDCAGRTCGDHGKACNGSPGVCECTGNGGTVQDAELACTDGVDNDCDGVSDCRDPNCQPNAAGPGQGCNPPGYAGDAGILLGFACDGTGSCSCSGNGGVAETADGGETVCGDGKDNDCDGLIDCAEANCQSVGNRPGAVCNDLGHSASGVGEMTCSAGTLGIDAGCVICTLPEGKVSEYGGFEGQTATSGATNPTCGDGVDNDCNGPIDCADERCTGQPCDLKGSKCTLNGACACVKTENSEVSCFDGVDNDCDGKVDCDDTNCVGLSCTIVGTTARGICLGQQGCGCPGQPEDGGVTCSDGADNDCDGKSDCEDPDCMSIEVITPTQQYLAQLGQVCDAKTGMRCTKPDPDNGGRAYCDLCVLNTALPDGGRSPETSCMDTLDNDCDGLVDCADVTCQPSGATPGAACRPDGGWACGASGTCDCSGNGGTPETSETSCGDGKDNDCDTLTDCEDPDCRPSLATPNGQACGGNNKFCSLQGLCACVPPDGGTFEFAETSCSDGIDNDCDGLVDCGEAACQPVGNNPGAICDWLGHAVTAPIGELTCSSPAFTDGGSSLCTVCIVPADAQGNPGRVEATEGLSPFPAITCGDGRDNDCDGVFDCGDDSCVGRTCDTTGKVCRAGQCQCPLLPDGGTALTEYSCNDGVDNDCDGKLDCQDPDCQPIGNGNVLDLPNCGTTADDRGLRCTAAGACACSGAGGQPQTNEGSCNDGYDNDCDGNPDCSDTDCKSPNPSFPDGGTCDQANANPPMVGYKCDYFGACVCPGGQSSETNCLDGQDNDCDGFFDCQDTDCQPAGAGQLGQACNGNGMRCTLSGTCADCRPRALDGGVGETAEVTCFDNVDNDCDGLVDCGDVDCQPVPPATTGRACKPPLADGGISPFNCILGGAGGGTGGGAGGGTGSLSGICLNPALQGNLTLSAAPLRIPSDGISTTLLAATLKAGATAESLSPITNLNCTGDAVIFRISNFSAGDGRLVDASDANNFSDTGELCAGTDNTGVAKVKLRSNAQGKSVVVTASFTDNAGLYNNLALTSDPVTVAEPKLGNVVVAPDPNYEKLMGVKSSGFRESQTISFILRDAAGDPYPEGLTVTFEHESKGSSFLGDTATFKQKTCTINGDCGGGFSCEQGLCMSGVTPQYVSPLTATATGKTDSSGKVSVTLRSGTVSSIVFVKALATAGGVTNSITVSDIAIVGAKTSGTNISLDCGFPGPDVVPGWSYTSGSKSLYRKDCTADVKIGCSAYFGDRFNNIIAIPTVTTIASEAGNAQVPGWAAPSASETDADKAKGWIVQGKSVNYIFVTGYGLPVDLAPDTVGGEPSRANTVAGLPTTMNPRDRISSVIVAVSGEEGFVDGSNNCPQDGVYNAPGSTNCAAGEKFVDIGEPFVDVDDNNTRSSGEYYIDSNSNGQWDGPNGTWDENTTVWTTTKVWYTGLPLTTTAKAYVNKQTKLSPTVGTTPGGFAYAILMEQNSSGSFYAEFGDNFLGPLPVGTPYTAQDQQSTGATFTWANGTIDLSTVNPYGVNVTTMFCPKNPARSPVPETPVITECTASCTAVDANNRCYPVTFMSNYAQVREVTFQIKTGAGAGTAYLGAGASAGYPICSNGQTLDQVSVSANTSATPIAICVRQTKTEACGSRTCDNVPPDNCGQSRPGETCGSCTGTQTCVSGVCQDPP